MEKHVDWIAQNQLVELRAAVHEKAVDEGQRDYHGGHAGDGPIPPPDGKWRTSGSDAR
jgi:hypothetical protein